MLSDHLLDRGSDASTCFLMQSHLPLNYEIECVDLLQLKDVHWQAYVGVRVLLHMLNQTRSAASLCLLLVQSCST